MNGWMQESEAGNEAIFLTAENPHGVITCEFLKSEGII
jgi:hypothetical protein